MSEPNRAVFLSYASQDADAARRICEALRGAGVEVWFDQSELRGGDAWDQKIRKQIKECALFVPIISANTQARREGYFRLEWRLADQRTHLMSHDTPFVVPVVIDDTRDHDARVPEAFLAVQWTRLTGSDTAAEFARRVRILVGMDEAPPAAATNNGLPPAAARSARAPRSRRAMIVGAILLLALGTAAATFIWRRPVGSAAATHPPPADSAIAVDAKAIAILPFESSGSSADSADFAAGIHEEIVTAVGRVAALKVIGRTSVLPYADARNRNLREIAALLKVASVVEGTVRRVGNRVKIAVQLVDTRTSRQLWGDSYERELTDVFAIQSAIAREVAARLSATLTAGERALLEQQPTASVAAYELFLQAQRLRTELIATSPLAEWERAVRLTEEAIAADPGFVQALALAVQLQTSMYWFPSLDPSPQRYELASRALARLRGAGSSAPEVAFAEAYFASQCERNWAESIRQCEKALVGMPNDSHLLLSAGFGYYQLGRYAESAAFTTRAYELNPLWPQAAINLAGISLTLRHFPAVARLRERSAGLPVEAQALLGRLVATAEYEIGGDRARFVRAFAELPVSREKAAEIVRAYEAALLAGDWLSAAKHLDSPQLAETVLPGGGGGGRFAVGVERAFLAYLLKEPKAATMAAEAEKQLSALQAEPRERPFVRLLLARAAAYRGDSTEALERARQVETEAPSFGTLDRINLVNEVGRIYALIGARDKAFACLRELMTGPSAPNPGGFGPPRMKRLDPCWAQLSSDPRFDQILKEAKPL